MARDPQRSGTRKLGQLEAYTPYPVHGLDRALGLRRSPLGGMVMVMGVLGALTALLFQLWVARRGLPHRHRRQGASTPGRPSCRSCSR